MSARGAGRPLGGRASSSHTAALHRRRPRGEARDERLRVVAERGFRKRRERELRRLLQLGLVRDEVREGFARVRVRRTKAER